MPRRDSKGNFIPEPPEEQKRASKSARNPASRVTGEPPRKDQYVAPGTSISARTGEPQCKRVTFAFGAQEPVLNVGSQHLRTISRSNSGNRTVTNKYMEHQRLLEETLNHVNDGTISMQSLLKNAETMQRTIEVFQSLSGNALDEHKRVAVGQFKLVEQLGKAYLIFQSVQTQAAPNEITKIVKKIYVAANKKAPQINNANFEEVIVGAAKLGLITGLDILMRAQRPDRVTFQKPRR